MILSVLAAIENESDREFMAGLYRTHYAALYRKARQYALNPQDAEDAVSAAMLRMIDHIDLLRTRNPAVQRSYLLSAVKNAALDCQRRRSRLPQFDLSDPEERLAAIQDDASVDDRLMRGEQVRACADALRALSARDRELLRMKYYDELTNPEIAGILGCRTDSVRTLLSRARERLRAIILEVDCHE